MEIYRYDKTSLVNTDLNPIEDLMNLLSALKSTGFTSDILNEVHGINDKKEIKETAKSISLHLNTAFGLADQGLNGNPETSFLPLYYSTLNLAKVYLLFLGKRGELKKNRWHGAVYSEKEMSRNFLNEKIQIKSNGTIPLIYKAFSGKEICREGVYVQMNEIYQNITAISAEFHTVTKQINGNLVCQLKIIQDNENGHYLRIHAPTYYALKDLPHPQKIKAFKGIKRIQIDNKLCYVTKAKKGNFFVVSNEIKANIQRYQLSDVYFENKITSSNWYSQVPISGKEHVFNEDLSIMLAYFHLSNVIRYNPEHLFKLMDSKYWAIILAMRKHGYLRFLKLTWGNIIQKTYEIH